MATKEGDPIAQRTLAADFRIFGKGAHTGQPVCLTLYPGEPDTGICFLRSDQPPSRGLILARWSNVVSAHYSADIGNHAGVGVRMVEHLLAALRLAGVDNALVVLNGPEVPALDGSAAQFLAQIDRVGTVEQDAPARTIVAAAGGGARGRPLRAAEPEPQPEADRNDRLPEHAVGDAVGRHGVGPRPSET